MMQLCITGEMNKRGPMPDPACSDRGPSVFMRGLMHHGIRSRNGVARRGAPRARGGLGSHVERSSPGVMQLVHHRGDEGAWPHAGSGLFRQDRGPSVFMRGSMHHGIRPRDGAARRAAPGRAAISGPPRTPAAVAAMREGRPSTTARRCPVEPPGGTPHASDRVRGAAS
ncbi:MAG: hypothetical protein A2X23_08160 [Chloroflexi bacterium GWC2_73_18]|nr:MAG: hypothetical protein A2X23_08160 [Chloroflexi bacterium GWC2_73_18]